MSDTFSDVKTKNRIKEPSMWRVVLHNDDYTPMDFVVAVLMQIFHKGYDEARAIMLTVHHQGRGQAGLYTKEVALQKVSEVREVAEASGHPLLTTAEEA